MNIQLTISLLVSDRIATLGRCLSSITPLLRELDAELIIVYTGHSPETLELAKQYTSHIIPFTWCNDFAKALIEGIPSPAFNSPLIIAAFICVAICSYKGRLALLLTIISILSLSISIILYCNNKYNIAQKISEVN